MDAEALIDELTRLLQRRSYTEWQLGDLNRRLAELAVQARDVDGVTTAEVVDLFGYSYRSSLQTFIQQHHPEYK